MIDIDNIPPDQVPALLASLEEDRLRLMAENKLRYYRPYPKQEQFHTAGAMHRERLLSAANQSGKTLAGGMEAAAHATGRYPDDWEGHRFDGPTVGWVAGETGETTRDAAQRVLIGRSGMIGTGSIPKDCSIAEIIPSRGVPEAVDIVRVHHVSGGQSTIGFKSYADGRKKFQGETLNWIWLDEEPPADIYTECLTRTNIGNGPVWITFTPLKGMSEVVRRFMQEKSPDRHVTQMDIEEADHFSPEERQRIIDSYPEHERDARTKGIPVLGSGLIFPVTDEQITCKRIDYIPQHWPQLGAMDFGWEHPFAAVQLAWDRDADVVYVTKAYRMSRGTPVTHSAALRGWGKELRWAWPRDGRREPLEGAGIALAEQYRDQGLNMHRDHAQFDDGGVSVERKQGKR